MDIKGLLEEYDVIMDSMEDETGLNEVTDEEQKNESVNEEKDLAETPADMKQAEYKDMKIKEPEIDDQPLAKKLLSQYEDYKYSNEYVDDILSFSDKEELINSEKDFEDFLCYKEGKGYCVLSITFEYEEPQINFQTEWFETKEEALDSYKKDFLDESLNEEYGEDFYHYSSYNKCKDVKKIKELIKTIRDDIKDAKEDDNKDLVSELKQDLNKAKALLKAAQDLKKNESKMNEISLDLAQKVNDERNKEAVLNQDDEELQKKAEKSNKLIRRWKKAKGYAESLKEAKTKKGE